MKPDIENESIRETELVLVHIDHKPGFFARVEEIAPDARPQWWQVRLLPLGMDNLDFKSMVWILDSEQICGAEYTMSGIPMRIEKVPPYKKQTPPAPPEEEHGGRGKVVSLANRKK